MYRRGLMGRPLHHAALCVRDVDASLRFYRDGLGLDVLTDHTFDGDWPALFEARTGTLRSVFLGDPGSSGAGVVELVAFTGGVDPGPPAAPPATGFFLLSFFVDVDDTLARLERLGLDAALRRVAQPAAQGSVAMATVRDPDGVLVELIEAGQAHQ